MAKIIPPATHALLLLLLVFVSSEVFCLSSEAMALTPINKQTYLQLFSIVQAATGVPFSMFPALGGADKTKWVDDELINREELRHTSTFLQGQIAIRKGSDPASVVELEQILQAASVLQKNFARIATSFDAKASLAISTEDIETFFAAQKAKQRGNPHNEMSNRD